MKAEEWNISDISQVVENHCNGLMDDQNIELLTRNILCCVDYLTRDTVENKLREQITLVDPNDMGSLYPYIPADDEDIEQLVTSILNKKQ